MIGGCIKLSKIGTLSEKSLHAALKQTVAQPGDQLEVKLDGYVIDIVRDDLLIEIQTGSFSNIKRKLTRLLDRHKILLIYPIAQEKWIVRETAVGQPISRRKSPKKGQPLDIFRELVRIPHLLSHPNLSLGIWLVQQEEAWRDDGQGSWRRKGWSKADSQLLAVVDSAIYPDIPSLLTLLPGNLAQPFTNQQLARQAKIRTNLAQKITYTLRHCEGLTAVGKKGNAILYKV